MSGMITADQTQRLWAIVRQWDAVRDGTRAPATVAEVIEYLITQEEIGIQLMNENEATEAPATITTEVEMAG